MNKNKTIIERPRIRNVKTKYWKNLNPDWYLTSIYYLLHRTTGIQFFVGVDNNKIKKWKYIGTLKLTPYVCTGLDT